MKELIEKDVAVILDKESNYLSVSLSGFISYERIVQIAGYIYALIEHYHIQKCMVDLQEIEVYAPGVPEFINTKWFPQVEKLGIKQLAFVVPESVFGKASMDKAHQGASKPGQMRTEHFMDKTKAKEWLKEPSPVKVK